MSFLMSACDCFTPLLLAFDRFKVRLWEMYTTQQQDKEKESQPLMDAATGEPVDEDTSNAEEISIHVDDATPIAAPGANLEDQFIEAEEVKLTPEEEDKVPLLLARHASSIRFQPGQSLRLPQAQEGEQSEKAQHKRKESFSLDDLGVTTVAVEDEPAESDDDDDDLEAALLAAKKKLEEAKRAKQQSLSARSFNRLLRQGSIVEEPPNVLTYADKIRALKQIGVEQAYTLHLASQEGKVLTLELPNSLMLREPISGQDVVRQQWVFTLEGHIESAYDRTLRIEVRNSKIGIGRKQTEAADSKKKSKNSKKKRSNDIDDGDAPAERVSDQWRITFVDPSTATREKYIMNNQNVKLVLDANPKDPSQVQLRTFRGTQDDLVQKWFVAQA